MQMNTDKKLLYEDLTGNIIKGFYNVYNTLGVGFLEKVYENALAIELESLGLTVKRQYPIKVYYANTLVGEYYADLFINNLVIVELKAADSLRKEHVAQLTNYLRATDSQLGLLLNFGAKPEFKRLIDTSIKKSV